jgi:hypothetical protein
LATRVTEVIVIGLGTIVDMSIADEAHDLRVGVHREEAIEVVIAPLPQHQPLGLEPTFD